MKANGKFKLTDRSYGRLHRVHPRLRRIVERAIEITDTDFVVIEGLREPSRQRHLIEIGKSWTLRSLHLMQPDGYAHAVDLMAVGDLDGDGDRDKADATWTWRREPYEDIAKAMKHAADELLTTIVWGGDWKRVFDGPHFQLALWGPLQDKEGVEL